jgi:hypothetical protein
MIRAAWRRGSVRYHKLPTVSKIPPTSGEVEHFISLVDSIRSQPSYSSPNRTAEEKFPYIAVHCHYGFNRTGYFIVCYLVERCGYTVDCAIEEFARKRPRGIRHEHFLGRLAVRYCKGLRGKGEQF